MCIRLRRMKSWRGISLMALAATLLLFPGSVGAAQASRGTATPEETVSILIRPLHDPAAGDSDCNALTGKLDDCPITDQLRQRLQNPIPNVETGNLVSRSQNPPRSVTISLVDIVADTARVNTRWDYVVDAYNIEFIVKNVSGSWLVADTFCEGNPHTSIFRTPVGPCSVESAAAAEAVPGMPTTGGSATLAYLLWLLGVFVTLGGAALRLRKNTIS